MVLINKDEIRSYYFCYERQKLKLVNVYTLSKRFIEQNLHIFSFT